MEMPRKITVTGLALLIAITVFICFFPVRDAGFLNFDDNLYVSENAFVKSGLSAEGINQMLRDTSTGHWHPMTWLSHMLDVELFGMDPGAHHLVNAALHSLNAGLLFLLIFSLSSCLWRSAIVALLFGLHPMRLESVAWLSERKDVLSMFFGIVTTLLYSRYVQHRSKFAFIGSLFFFGCTLAAKPTFVTLPLLLLLIDFWPLRRFSYRAVFEKIPFVALSLIFSLVVIYAQAAGQGLRGLSEISFESRTTSACVGILAYFGKFFLPTGMGIFYPFMKFPPGIGVGAACGIIALTALFLSHLKARPYLTFGWTWFLIALLPVAGFVSIGGQSFADRWSYLPHIGLLIGLIWFAADIFGQLKFGRTAAIALPLFIIAVCFFETRRNLPFWKDSESIFAHTLELYPDNFMAHTNLGIALDAAGSLDSAIPHFEEAVRLNPTYPEALNNLGMARARLGNLSEASSLFQRALGVRADFYVARYNYGLTLADRGDLPGAATEWLRVISYQPNYQAAADSLRTILSRGDSQLCAQAVANLTEQELNNLRTKAAAADSQRFPCIEFYH